MKHIKPINEANANPGIQIKSNLFNLTSEQEEMSKMIYDGKIIKCLVAPYHSYEQLEKIVPFTKNTFLFPERELPASQLSKIVAMIVKTPSDEEFRIITANQIIILDMIDDCVRVLTEGGDVVDCPCKTFMANIHDIRYKLLENPDHQISEAEKNKASVYINKLIDRVNNKKKMTQKEFVDIKNKIQLIGEPIIRVNLIEMLDDKHGDDF